MKPIAIVYTSSTGHTQAYGQLLSKKIGLPLYTIKESKASLPAGSSVIYLGWLMAGTVKDYRKVAKRYTVAALCGICLGPSGSQIESVRKSTGIEASTPVFTLQGGLDHAKLRGVHRMMIGMLTKMLQKKTDRTSEEEEQLQLLLRGGNFVSEKHLTPVLSWYQETV